MSLIRETRIELGFNQVELAKLLDIRSSTLSRYESGSRKLSLKSARKLMALVNKRLTRNITLDQLMGDYK